jgi:hypothetical protein
MNEPTFVDGLAFQRLLDTAVDDSRQTRHRPTRVRLFQDGLMSSSSRRAPLHGRRCGSAAGSLIAALLVAGCAPAVPAPMTDSPPPRAPTTPDGQAAPTDLPSLIRAVSDDAARRSGVDPARVRVLEAGAVTWSDGSLGCPEPDRMYTQALVPGYRVRVEAGGQQFDYHAGARGTWRLCPAERARPPLPNGGRV